MPIQGLRDTSNFVAEQRPKNWREGILRLEPNGMAPLTALTSLMKEEKTDDPEYNWWEKGLPSQRAALSANIDTTQVAIGVVSGALAYRDSHVLRVENTGELLLVNGNPTVDTSVTVIRGFAGSTATAVTYNAAGVNPNIQCVGSAHEEGSMPPNGINYDPTKKYNYTQIWRNTLEMTRTASKTRLRTGDAVKEAKRECLEQHSIEMEKGFIWGLRTETTKNGKPLRTTGGFISFIDAANVVHRAGAATDMETLEGWLEQFFRYGSSEKLALCGTIALKTINQIVRKNSSFNIESGIKEYGMLVSRLFTPFGTLVLKTHPLFAQLTGGTTGGSPYYGYSSAILGIDTKNIKYRYIDDTKYESKLEANGLDGMQSGYITEAGMEIHHPTTHFLITGLADAAVDS